MLENTEIPDGSLVRGAEGGVRADSSWKGSWKPGKSCEGGVGRDGNQIAIRGLVMLKMVQREAMKSGPLTYKHKAMEFEKDMKEVKD